MPHPTCSTPVGGTVTVTIPSGWYTFISGLSRNTYNSLIRIRVSEGNSTHIERFSSEWGKANDIMKLERTHKTESYALPCSDTAVTLELATFYSTNPRIKDRALEEAPNTGSKALSVVQAHTPLHMFEDFPDYVTFFVFVQDSATQVATENTPLFNDTVCTINVIRGTGHDHHGKPMNSGRGTSYNPVLEDAAQRPSSEEPIRNSIRINMPEGWFAFISGLSRTEYNQAIRLQYTEESTTVSELFISQFNATDDIMKLKRTREEALNLESLEGFPMQLDASFYWSKSDVSGIALVKDEYASRKLKAVEMKTPERLRDNLPDCVTYLVMAEDQAEDEQEPGVPDCNDAVCIINFIRNTPMVFKGPGETDDDLS